MWMILLMKTKEVIVGVMVQDVELGLKKSGTIILPMMKKVLLVTGDVDLGLISAPLPSIIKVLLVDNLV